MLGALVISTALLIVCGLISKNSLNDSEKNSSYECGFDPLSDPRLPFPTAFYLIMVIFVVFDVEIVLLISYLYNFSISMGSLFSLFWFIMILLLGLMHEWREGSLYWK